MKGYIVAIQSLDSSIEKFESEIILDKVKANRKLERIVKLYSDDLGYNLKYDSFSKFYEIVGYNAFIVLLEFNVIN